MLGLIEYWVAWACYCAFGGLFAWQLFALSKDWNFLGRALIRGSFLVVAFTPWSLGAPAGYYAPAVVVLLMDLLLKGSGNTLEGGLALSIAYLGMVAGIAVYGVLQRRKNLKAQPSDEGA